MKIQRRSQLGFGILEMTVAIAVGLIATVSGVRWYVEYTDQAVFDVAAQQQKQVTESVASYLRDNRESVKATLNANGSVNPNAITLHDLSKNGYLPKHLLDNPACNSSASCKMTSPYLQEYKVGTRLTGTGPAQRVEAVLYTKPSTGLTLREATAISRRVGAVGGAIDGGGNKITGSLGGWEVAATTFGAGGAANTYGVASAVFFEDGMEVGDYIHRNSVPGRPELNQMETNLSLGGNDITAARNVTTTGLVSAKAVTASETVNTKDLTASETVNTKDLVVSDKASVRNNITSEAGWLIAKNSSAGLQADRFRSVSSVGGQGEASWVDSGGKLVFNVNKGVKVSGRLETTEYLSLGGTATEGDACEKDGLVAKDSSGALLSCQYGSWKGAQRRLPPKVGSSVITGLSSGESYLVSVYGVTSDRGDQGATLSGVRVYNSSGKIIANTPNRHINWHDGSAPQSASLLITAPTDGYISATTDGGSALYMSAVHIN